MVDLPWSYSGRRGRQVNSEARDLAVRAARGDVDAFTKLVRAHSSLVYRVSLPMLRSEDAEDTSKEVWVRVWRNIKGFRGDSAFSTWLYRITVNICLGVLQKESRRQEYGEGMPYLPEPSAGDAEAAVLSAERREESAGLSPERSGTQETNESTPPENSR